MLEEVREIGLKRAHRLDLLSQALVVVIWGAKTWVVHFMFIYFIKSNDNNIHDQVDSLVKFDS